MGSVVMGTIITGEREQREKEMERIDIHPMCGLLHLFSRGCAYGGMNLTGYPLVLESPSKKSWKMFSLVWKILLHNLTAHKCY